MLSIRLIVFGIVPQSSKFTTGAKGRPFLKVFVSWNGAVNLLGNTKYSAHIAVSTKISANLVLPGV